MQANLGKLMDKHSNADEVDKKKMKAWEKLIVHEMQKEKLNNNTAFKSFIFNLNEDIAKINRALLFEKGLEKEARNLLMLRREWCEKTLKPFISNKAVEKLDRDIKESLKLIDNNL